METVKHIQIDRLSLLGSDKLDCLKIPAGQLVAIVGKNGAGKTTLLHFLAGDRSRSHGIVSPHPLSTSIVPQDPQFPSHFAVRDYLCLAFLPQVGMWGRFSSDHENRIAEILAQFEMTSFSTRRLGALSAGERQRIFLARALLEKPELLLLDEPTNHLDWTSRERFWNRLVEKSQAAEISILVATHEWGLIQKGVTWVVALDEGRPVFCGNLSEFRQTTVCSELFS